MCGIQMGMCSESVAGLRKRERLSEPNVEFARLKTIKAYLGSRVRVGLTGLCTKAASDNRIQNRERSDRES
jgi:hypothetical protein